MESSKEFYVGPVLEVVQTVELLLSLNHRKEYRQRSPPTNMIACSLTTFISSRKEQPLHRQ
jgi:hypothetical protein